MSTLTRLDCGELRGDLSMFEVGADGQVTLPVSAWLIRHPPGTMLFDTGMPAEFVERSDRARLVEEEVKIGFGVNDTVGAQLEAVSQDPGRVDFGVISHLHFDHVGGLSMIPNATLVIQRKEWEAGMAVDHEAETHHARGDYDLGHMLCLITELVFCDMCPPTRDH